MRRINLIQARGFFFRKEDGCNATQIGTGAKPNIKKKNTNELFGTNGKIWKGQRGWPFQRAEYKTTIQVPQGHSQVVDAPLTGRCSHPCGRTDEGDPPLDPQPNSRYMERNISLQHT
jgi:hypothetical protein